MVAGYRDRVPRSPSSVHRVLELLPAEPAVTAALLGAHTSMPAATAFRSAERLVAAGILKPAGKVRGTQVWVATDILAALDAFAARASQPTRR